MKKDSAELFQLVAALTASEKRYCTLYLKRNTTQDDNRYLALFNCMKEEGEYDSIRIKKQLQYVKRPNHYAVLKKQLYQQLLDALHLFSIASNPEQQLMQEINQCSLLLQKNLVVQCEKKIAVLWKTAKTMDLGVAQLLLQNLKLDVMSKKKFRQVTDKELDNWELDTMNVHQDLETLTRYRYLHSTVFKMNYEHSARSTQLTARMKTVIELPEFSDDKKARTVHATALFYHTKAQYYFHNMDAQKSMEYLEKNLLLLENNPQTNLPVNSYQITLYNYLITCLELKKYDLFENSLEKLRNIPNMPAFRKFEKSYQDSVIFYMSYTLEMDYFIDTGQFHMAYLKTTAIEKGLELYGDKIAKRNRIVLQSMMAYVCFAMAQYDDALKYVMPVIQEKENAVAADIQLIARMTQLLCHFEKSDKLLSESLIKSLQRSIRDKDESGDILRAVLSFITSTLRIAKPKQEHWLELHKKLNKLLAKRTPEGISNLFKYNVWALSHAEKISFTDAWKKEPHK